MAPAVLGVDPQDAELNSQNGAIESVVSVWNGSEYDVQFVSDPGGTDPPDVDLIVTPSVDDLDPKIAIDGTGHRWVVWWRNGSPSSVLVTDRSVTGTSWSSPETLSDPGDDASSPIITIHDSDPFVAFEIDASSGTDIAVTGGTGPDPWPERIIVANTGNAGDLDMRWHSESGELWLTWIDSSTQVGYVVYDAATDTWSVAAYESYTNDPSTARDAIRDAVLN